MKYDGTLPKGSKPLPREVHEAALTLIKLAKQYGVPVDQAMTGAVDRKLAEEVVRLAGLTKRQQQIIARLEHQLGVTDEL